MSSVRHPMGLMRVRDDRTAWSCRFCHGQSWHAGNWHFGNCRKHFLSQKHCDVVLATSGGEMVVDGKSVYATELVKSIQDDVVVQTCKRSFAHTCAQVSLDCTARAFRAVAGKKGTPYGVLSRLRKLGFVEEARKLARLNAVTSTASRGNKHKSQKKMQIRLGRMAIPSRILKLAKVHKIKLSLLYNTSTTTHNLNYFCISIAHRWSGKNLSIF